MSIRKAAAALVATAALTLGALATTPSLAAADSEGQKAQAAPAAQVNPFPYRGKVLGNSVVYKRAKPTTRSDILGWADSGTIVRIQCKVIGQNVLGNNRWYRVPVRGGGYGYMSARYVLNLDQIPFCRP
ncbi:SH3 domain-containing protein [Streptomyces sp. WAC 06738]|uniref:SH3 domain-containing protein n=1 Tax=Streptomyces sp. WAC 06738 TaxID=2203210 RepID=UPI000F6B5129|nr:SH3 domain-containing protein [Streptomyces sp. WAC 06738]AZM44490.1 SH3 domain-containing protein [Streptomyces sp. WAC 06738]